VLGLVAPPISMFPSAVLHRSPGPKTSRACLKSFVCYLFSLCCVDLPPDLSLLASGHLLLETITTVPSVSTMLVC
jgi:hypothetical protein